MKITILLANNDAYFSEKCKKSYFLTKYRISAQNRIRPWYLLPHDNNNNIMMVLLRTRVEEFDYAYTLFSTLAVAMLVLSKSLSPDNCV